MTRSNAQAAFEFPRTWGGARPGAGRKPNGPKPRVPHKARPILAARYPVHITVRVRPGLPSLRRLRAYRTIREAFRAGRNRFGFRLNQYTVLGNHVHLIGEAIDRRALSRGMQGLLIRMAKALNRLWDRSGSVFADRYHGRILRTPREVRNALAYVLLNARRHGIRYVKDIPDPFSSGTGFDGWRDRRIRAHGTRGFPHVASAKTWLQRVGWRRYGLVKLDEIPGFAKT